MATDAMEFYNSTNSLCVHVICENATKFPMNYIRSIVHFRTNLRQNKKYNEYKTATETFYNIRFIVPQISIVYHSHSRQSNIWIKHQSTCFVNIGSRQASGMRVHRAYIHAYAIRAITYVRYFETVNWILLKSIILKWPTVIVTNE